jgi:D-3-phosphoglycerate dehydrogenase / 2-oxoglutarate reductase
MYKIQTLNSISLVGLKQFTKESYEVANEISNPDAILIRSSSLHETELPASVQVVARAGAGVNNIPIDKLTRLGIPVFNTPGANANAVKELVIAGMLVASRHLFEAHDYVKKLQGNDAEINKQVEQDKKQFAGFELYGKTLGVVGLGNVGAKVANAARALGMRVLGYDPAISVKQAWALSTSVEEVKNLDDLIGQSDFISLHVPLIDETRDLINTSRLQLAKSGVILLNFSRDGIVEKTALRAALDSNHVSAYVTDFPCAQLKDHPRVISLPHLGASTQEAEELCAVMAVKQIRDYLENGTITYSVNFPSVEIPFKKGVRLTIVNANVPGMVAKVSAKLASASLNIVDMLNKSRDEIAYTVIDLESEVSDTLIKDIAAIKGVLRVSCLKKS